VFWSYGAAIFRDQHLGPLSFGVLVPASWRWACVAGLVHEVRLGSASLSKPCQTRVSEVVKAKILAAGDPSSPLPHTGEGPMDDGRGAVLVREEPGARLRPDIGRKVRPQRRTHVFGHIERSVTCLGLRTLLATLAVRSHDPGSTDVDRARIQVDITSL